MVEPDGFLHIRFINPIWPAHPDAEPREADYNMRVYFKELWRGWSIQDGCLKLNYKDQINMYPMSNIYSLDIIRNSEEVSDQLEMEEFEPTNTRCVRCGIKTNGAYHG